MNANDFLRGQQDCINGIPHQLGESDSYNNGYQTQYTAEQVASEMTKNER